MDKEIILQSGKKLSFQYADFETEQDLYDIITQELEKKDVNLKDGEAGAQISAIKALISLTGTRKITEQFWRCANTCLYEGERITPKTFQNIEARKDYLEIKFHVVWNNISVFFSTLLGESKLQENFGADAIQKVMQSLSLKSTTTQPSS